MSGLAIDLRRDSGRITRVAVAGSRPETARVLVGRRPTEALALLRRLYAVCGHAQHAAGALALGAAGALPEPAAAESQALVERLRAEAAREHCWRLLVDWPVCVGIAPDRVAFAAWHRRCDGAAATWAAPLAAELRRWLGTPEAETLAAGAGAPLARHDRWLDAAPTPFATLLRAVRALDSRVLERPDDETGAYPRLAEHPWLAALAGAGRGLEARVVARFLALAELAESGAGPELDASAAGEGGGRAAVGTARGMLVHSVRVAGDRVVGYAIRTPTDLNFATGGPYARRVEGLACADDAAALRLARAWALALDPCVPYAVRIAGDAPAVVAAETLRA